MQKHKQPAEFWVRSVDLWNSDEIRRNCDLFIRQGAIEEIRSSKERQISGSLLPSGVDPQVHLRVPGQPEKETAMTGLRACVRGGIAAILTMPNTRPVIDSPKNLQLGRDQTRDAELEYGVRVFWSAAATMGQNGQQLVDFLALKKAGALAFTDDGKGLASDELMEKALAQLSDLKLPFLQHAEFPGHGGVLAACAVQKQLGVQAYASDPEWKMVERDLRLLKKYPNARYHVLHISSARTVELLHSAKNQGLNATGEVSPHHLLLSCDDIVALDSSYKMNPPLRDSADREALLRGLINGDIDFVATDHAPHEPACKTEDFKKAAFGTTGLETALRVLLHFLYLKKISAEKLVSVFADNPAKFLGLESEFGSLKEGRPFYATMVDATSEPTPITESDLASLNKNNCFLGRPLAGKIIKVFQPEHNWTF